MHTLQSILKSRQITFKDLLLRRNFTCEEFMNVMKNFTWIGIATNLH